MDEDIRFTMSILCTNSGAGATDRYWVVPYRCTFRDLIAIASNSDPGDADTVTVYNNTQSKTLGVATFGSDIAAGAKATWAADAIYGDLVCAQYDVLKITVSQTAAATDIIGMIIELDPKCRAV